MAKKYDFTKMHAFGNDFVIFDFRSENTDVSFSKSHIIVISDRNFGIGCDQLIMIYKASKPDDEKGVNVMIRVFNQDGTEAQNCGNGIRCVVGYIARESLKPLVRVQIGKKVMLGKPDRKSSSVLLNMGVPVINGDVVELGNKHKIIVATDINNIQQEPDPEYNLHYIEIRSRKEVFMRTIERGVGETLSCGSGTCAVAAYCISNDFADNDVSIISRGSYIAGEEHARVSWGGVGKPILLSGKYSFVFTGTIEI